MKKTIIIVLAALLVGGGAAFFILSPKPPPEKKSATHALGDSFITNIKDSKSLLKTSLILEYDSTADAEKKATFLEEHNTVIRDVVVFTLREKTEDELSASGVQDTLKAELIRKIKEKLGIDYIESIYFNDYVLQ